MAEISYRLTGLPAEVAARGMSAFLPNGVHAAAGGSRSYKYAVDGGPGTHMVPAPPPPVHEDLTGQAQMGTARSPDAPDAWWPASYHQGFAVERVTVQTYDPTLPALTTILPLPAHNVGLTARTDSARLSRRAVLNRVRQLPWFPRIYKAPSA